MTFSASFFVFGTPKAQPRHRSYAAKMGGKHVARVYDPGTASAWKATIGIGGNAHAPADPLVGPVRVSLEFSMPRPKRLMRRKDPEMRLLHVAKPDVDNLAKAVLDAMTDAGWWIDDSQVSELALSKHYHHKAGAPGVLIRVLDLEENS